MAAQFLRLCSQMYADIRMESRGPSGEKKERKRERKDGRKEGRKEGRKVYWLSLCS